MKGRMNREEGAMKGIGRDERSGGREVQAE